MKRSILCGFLVAVAVAACSQRPSATTTTSAATAQPGKQRPAPAAVPAAASAAPTAYDDSRGLIVALGDSITSGAGASSPAKTYVGQLSADLRTRSVNLGGYGVTADMLLHAVPRIPERATNVIIYAGTNDVTAATEHVSRDAAIKQVKIFEHDFDRLVGAVQARVPRAQIVLVTVRDLGRSGVHSNEAGIHEPDLTAAAHEWNEHERRYAAEHGITAIVDTETDPQWYDKSEYLPNAFHPNDKGAARLAGALAPLIKRP